RDYELIDTWHVPGLKATGSNDLVVKDVFVPEHRTLKFADTFRGYGPGQAVNTALLYKLPFGQIFFRGISTGGIGCLKGMLDLFLEYATTRTTRSLPTVASQDPLIHLLCAEVSMAVDEMKAMIHRDFRVFEGYAAKGEMPPMQTRLRTKFYNGLVAERCL